MLPRVDYMTGSGVEVREGFNGFVIDCRSLPRKTYCDDSSERRGLYRIH